MAITSMMLMKNWLTFSMIVEAGYCSWLFTEVCR